MWWCVVVCGGVWWCVVVCCGVLWCVVVGSRLKLRLCPAVLACPSIFDVDGIAAPACSWMQLRRMASTAELVAFAPWQVHLGVDVSDVCAWGPAPLRRRAGVVRRLVFLLIFASVDLFVGSWTFALACSSCSSRSAWTSQVACLPLVVELLVGCSWRRRRGPLACALRHGHGHLGLGRCGVLHRSPSRRSRVAC